MREYTNKIALTLNKRGCYSLDTIIGCSRGIKNNPNGCYGECYAANYSKRYGYKFGSEKLRYFESEKHMRNTINKINKISMSFVRMGTSGDPSSNWQHTIDIIKLISSCERHIVIVTKHWELLTHEQLVELSKHNVIINTSISALDEKQLIDKRLEQYIEIKNYCKSILRIVSCDFNLENEYGNRLAKIQNALFNNENVIDNILRVSKNNKYVLNGVIKVTKERFLNSECSISRYNKDTYFGNCYNCIEMCGVNMGKTK